MKKLLALCMTAVLLLGLCTSCSSAGKDNKNKVVIFSSAESYRNDELEKQLKDKLPDINVVVQQISTGNNAAKIQAEGTSTEADIIFGLETASFEKIIDNFAPLDGFTANDYLDEFKNEDNRSLIWEKYEGSIIINPVELEKLGLPEPQSYEDLLNPIYKDLIVMPNPKTSGTGYMFLNMWVKTMGEEKAFAFVDELQKNIKQFTESGSGPIQMLNQGEAVIGLGMVFQAAEQIGQGAPLKIIIPKEGCPYNTTQFGIIKGKENNENVRKVFDYINGEFFKFDKENYAPGKIVKDQVSTLKDYPNDVPSGDMSTITDMELKEQLLAKWKY